MRLLFRLLVLTGISAPLARAQYTQWASEPLPGFPAQGIAVVSEVSGDGSTVVFLSVDDNLVLNDNNGLRDVFAFDRATGSIEVVSAGASGAAAGADAYTIDVSADGRYVVFNSSHPGLVNLTYSSPQIFVRDRWTQETVILSLWDLGFGLAPGTGWSPRMSRDGRFVSFWTSSPPFGPSVTLVVADRDVDGNGVFDEQPSPDIRGVVQAAGLSHEISDDARYVAYSKAVAVTVRSTYVLDRDADGNGIFDEAGGTLEEHVAIDPSGNSYPPSSSSDVFGLSADGRHVLLSIQGNILLRDRVAGTSIVLALGPLGGYEGALSTTGRFVAYPAQKTDGTGGGITTLHDRDPDENGLFDEPGLTTTIEVGVSSSNTISSDDNGPRPGVSDDGRIVCFESRDGLVPGAPSLGSFATQVYVHETGLGPYLATYCTATTSSAGCNAAMGWNGFASLSDPTPFSVESSNVPGLKVGLLFYGFGSAALPFLGGTLCVQPPLRRTAPQFSGGMTPNDCTGALTYDFNARIQSGDDPFLVLGQATYAQYWFRDPASASGSALSNALQFTVLP